MINRIGFLALLVLVATSTKAQFQDPQTYQLSFGLSKYQALSGSDSLLNREDGKPCVNCVGDFWSDDETDGSIKVFNFPLYDFDINLYLQTYKSNTFPLADNISADIGFEDTLDFWHRSVSRIVLLFKPLEDRGSIGHSASPIRKKIEGTKPNRVLKVEYRNAGFTADDTNLDSINIQFWYIEADSSIELHWGKCSVKNQKLSDPNDGKDHFFASLMTRDPYNGSPEFYETIRVGGTVDSLFEITSDAVSPFTFKGVPYEGQYFRFSRKKVSVSIAEQQALAAEVFPNPTTDFIYVRGIDHQQLSTAKVYNLSGQIVLNRTLSPLEDRVDVQALSKGLYLLQLVQGNKYYTTRLVKD